MTATIGIDRDAALCQFANLSAAVLETLTDFLDEHRLLGHDLTGGKLPADMTVGDYLLVLALVSRGLTHHFSDVQCPPDQDLLEALGGIGRECVAECGEGEHE